MSRDELQQALAKLRDELDALGPEHAHTRERLETLVSEVESELAALDAEADHESVIESMKTRLEQFEVEHPRITNILNDIMVTLSNLGI